MDDTRKGILSITSSTDCFIIIPDNFKQKKHIVAATSSPNAITNTSSLSCEYYTQVSDLPNAIAVRFEPGDLEAVAMQTFRSIAAPNDDHFPSIADSVDAQGSSSSRNNNMNKLAWQSWAVRRVQGQVTFGSEISEYPSILLPPSSSTNTTNLGGGIVRLVSFLSHLLL